MNITLERIRHFTSLTGGCDLVIVFSLAPTAPGLVSAKHLAATIDSHEDNSKGVTAYSQLSAELLCRPEIPHVPILLLDKLDQLPKTLERHVASLASPPPRKRRPSTASFEMLQLYSVNPPLPREVAFVLSDVFPSTQALAMTCQRASSAELGQESSEGSAGELSSGSQGAGCGRDRRLERLRVLVGEEQFRNIVDFWREEWTVE